MGDFRLAEVLRGQLQNAGKNVSNLDTSDSPQQIEYIDIGLLDGDPRNRRDLRGLEELAANIELLGLRQPLRAFGLPGQRIDALDFLRFHSSVSYP